MFSSLALTAAGRSSALSIHAPRYPLSAPCQLLTSIISNFQRADPIPPWSPLPLVGEGGRWRA